MAIDQNQRVDAIKRGKIEWSNHALRKMLEKGISTETVKYVICSGEEIEYYPDDRP